MFLHRIIDHVRQQHWTAIFLDFLMVVLGVYIGLQAQEWSNRQEDRQREMQIIGDLLADLDIDRALFANVLLFDERQVAAANASLEGAGLPPIDFSWDRPETETIDYTYKVPGASAIPVGGPDKLWTDVVIGYYPTTSTSTYDAMVGAGDMRIIRDRSIVREIQIYHNLTGSVSDQNRKLLAIRATTLSTGAAFGLAPYAAMPAADYFRLVAGTPQLAATIRIQGTFVIFHHGEIRSADESAARLQQRLKDYLASAN